MVTPQNWLFLTSYTKLRQSLLRERTWNAFARLGTNAFRDMNFWAATTALVVLSAGTPSPRGRFCGLDASHSKDRQYKRNLLRGSTDRPGGMTHDAWSDHLGKAQSLVQADQLLNPDARVALVPPADAPLLGAHARALQGTTTGDNDRFLIRWWESPGQRGTWTRFQSPGNPPLPFGGCTQMLRWEQGRGELAASTQARIQGQWAFEKRGVVVGQMSSLPVSHYLGEMFDMNGAVVVPRSYDHLAAVWCYCSSTEYGTAVRAIDQALKVTNASLVKVPFDLPHWQKVAAEKYPDGLPEPQSDDPTQWLFHGYPAKAEAETVLQVAVARLLGYRWPPEVDPEMRLADEARAWVERCADLAGHADPDGVVCLNATRGESPAADRLRQLLAAAFGSDWPAGKERQLLAAAAGDAKPARSLEEWLRDSFFAEHCKLFHHRPFVWPIWDGRKDGFQALVNYHRLAGPEGEGHRTLQAITYSYLGDWIERQRAGQREGMEGADGRLAAAQDLQAQLEKILEGEPPCDLFIRWKALHEQPIGWQPDINDGVRLNIRPFMSVELRTGGRKGAGVLRWKPNINWKKDRGKEPESLRPRDEFPWFWSCPGDGALEERTDSRGRTDFDGNRWNDLHYTVACKQDARTAQSESGSDSTPTAEKVDGVRYA